MSESFAHTLGDRFATSTARLAWLLFPHTVANKLLMFVAYFDDAGTHDDTATEPGSQIVAVAGYVGTPADWDAFEVDWNAFLRREGLKFYHTVDCMHSRKQFEGREPSDCN